MECGSNIPIEKIHSTSHAIAVILEDRLKDIVPAYHSIAVFTSLDITAFSDLLSQKANIQEQSFVAKKTLEIPICYELGLDLERVAKHSNREVDQVISLHLDHVYRAIFIGFTPGFIYSDGLDERLSCPRLDSPRKRIASGSVGIAGGQTGIYSLESPGGWNIIGRTPIKIFDMHQMPPMLISVGTTYRFRRITKKEFDTWED